jgi:peptidyl-prolyl cis-trans isomerase D
MSPEMFEARVRSDISSRQVLAGIGASGLTTPAIADVSLNAFFERREVQVARFATAEFAAKATITDGQLDSFYKDNPALFQAPEQANIEYLVLDIESIRKTITLNADDVQAYFKQNADSLSSKEERRASHILIAAAKTAPAAERPRPRPMPCWHKCKKHPTALQTWPKRTLKTQALQSMAVTSTFLAKAP